MNFPDEMSKEDIKNAIDNDIYPQFLASKKQQQPEDNSSDLVRGFKAYPSGLQETFGGAQTLLGVGAEKTFGKSGVSDYLIEKGSKNLKEAEAEQQRTAKPTDEFTNAWEAGIGAVITDWLPYQIGSGAANLLETAAVAATGAAVGSIAVPGAGTLGGGLTGFVSKKLIQNGIKEAAEKVLKERGKDAAEAFIQAESKKVVSAEVAALAEAGAKKAIGSTAAMVGQAGFHGMGEVTGAAVQEAERQGLTARDIDLGRVLPAVAVHSAADFIANKIGLGALDGLASPTKSMLLNVAKSIGVTGLKEVPPEVLQTAMELYGAGLPLDDQAAIHKYINTAAAAFGMSVVPGGIGGMRSRVVEKAADPTAPDQTGLDQTNALGQIADPATADQGLLALPAPEKLLALPAPATLVEPEPMQPSLQNPLGDFTYDNFNPEQMRALNDLRKADGKPKLPQTFSIEDIADLSPAKGVLDALITAKSGYNGEQVTFQQLIDIAQLKNIDITTQGFRDFLRRATGTEELENLSPPQLFAATKALDSIEPFEEMTILPTDVSNATHYTPQQYNKAIGGIDLAFKEVGGKPLGRQAMLTEIKDFTGLKDRDAERILQQAIRDGHIEQRDEVRNVNGEQKVVPSFMPAQNVEQLPGGMDIRKQKFKQADGSTKEQFVYYDNDEPVARFDDQYQAERYGITQQPDNVLDRIVKSYKDQRGLRAQRYGVLAEREIESRKNPEINRAVTTKQGEEGATERLGELGITYVEFKPEVKEALPEIMRILAPALNKLGLSRIGIKLADTIDNGGTDGFYFKGIITIALDQDNPLGIMRHEVIHALKALGVFTPSELKTLEKFAKKSLAEGQFFDQKMQDLYKEKYLQTHPDLNGFDEYMQEEVMAEAFRYFTGNKPPAGFFQNMMYRLNAMFRAIGNAFRSVKLTTPEQIFADIESGEIGSRTGTNEQEDNAPSYALRPNMSTKEGIIQDGIKRYAEALKRHRIGELEFREMAPRKLNALDKIHDGIVTRLQSSGISKQEAEELVYQKVVPSARQSVYRPDEKRYSLVRPAVAGETEISTQNPQGAKRKYDPITQMLSIDEAAVREGMKLNPKNKKAIINAIKGYGFIPNGTPDSQAIEVFKQNIVNNLLYLYNSVPEDTRQRSKLWYDGANRMAIDMGKAFGVTKEQVAGIMAAMSPQKDWFQNVSMAERALDILTTQGNKSWDDNMLKYAESYVNESKDRKELEKRKMAFEKIKDVAKKGTTLDKMGPNEAAAFVRAYDEAFNSREYRIVTPEGGFGGLVTKANGEPATMMWSTYDPIKKSVLIYRDGSRPNISNQLGAEHKIRSFYNNIAAPKSDIGHVTIDTHAVAAALFEALAGSDEPVTHNFGGTGKSSLIGVGGTYGIIADAYRTAAAQVNMLPREMQSITWEAVRGLFNADIKNTIKPKIRSEWEKYKKGELSFEQARENAVKIATTAQGVTDNKIPEPDWKDSGKGQFVSAGGASYDKSFKPEGDVRLRPQESIREKLSVNLSAVTESIPGLAELYKRSKGKDLKAYALLQRVAEARLNYLLGGTGAKITVDDIKGVFLGDREPSIAAIISFDESQMKPVLAALAQFAESFNQIQVHVRQPTAFKFGHKYGDGSYATVVYKIELKKSLSESAIAKIIDESGLQGFSVSKDTLTAYWVDENKNSQESKDEFAKQLKQVHKLVGKLDSNPKQTIERLFVYGTKDSGAPIGYDKISGDLRTAEGSDTKTAKLIADYLDDGDIEPFKQKPLTQGQTKDQKLLYQIFTKLPENDLKNPLVRKAYNHLIKDLIKQYKTLPIKAEVVTNVTLNGNTYSYFGEKSEELKEALSKGMTEAEADQAIKYLVDNYGEPNPAWKDGLLSKIEPDKVTLYGNIADNMRRDVSENNRLKVYKTAPQSFGPKNANFSGHPLLKDSGLKDINGYPMLFNDLLRVVHDYYAHNLSNASFGPQGEFTAQRNHMAVTPDPWSRWAIIAETRAQNAWQNFRPEVEGMSLKDRPYAAQKAALPPIDFVLTGNEKLDAPVRVLMDELTPAQRLGSLKESDAGGFKGTSVKPPKPPKTAEKENVESPAGAVLSIRAPNTPAFKRWFGDSKVVNKDGSPKVMYHGTARDITEFRPKQAGAIFVTEKPDFAEGFASNSINYMRGELLKQNPDLKEEGANYILDKAVKDGWLSKKEANNYRDLYMKGLEPDFDNIISLNEEGYLNFLDQYLTSSENIMPLFVRAEKPFDYDDPKSIEAIRPFVKTKDADDLLNRASMGLWQAIESNMVQDAIKKAGFDSFYVNEGGVKNLAVYEPNQLKSATGNTGAFGRDTGDIRYAIRPPSGPVNEPLITKVGTQATTKQQVTTAYEETVKAYKSSDLRQKARIALVDPSSALAQSLAALPHFDMNGTLRADMIYHAGKQGINLIKNGMVTGDVVVSKDGSLEVKDSKDNLAAAAKLADSIDNNPYVRATTDKGRSVSGRQYVGEIARILRGADIIADDAQTRADGLAKIAASKAMYKRVKGMPLTKQRVALVRQMAKLRSEGLKESKVNREKQVNKAQIAWAEHQLKSVPEVKEILRIWKAVNTGLVDLHESVGILSKERADEFRGRDRYVPLFKAREDLEDTVFNFSGTGAKSVAKGHKLEGSEAIRNIWENVDKQYASMVATAYENQTRKVAAEQLISLSPTTGSKFAETTKNPKDSRINLRYLEDGKIVNVIVENPNDVAAFQMMNYELGPIMKAVSGLSKTLRVGALLNPMFWLKQLIRDPIHATIVAGTGIITPFHSARGFIKILSKNSKEADILARHGVIGAYDSTLSMAQYLKDVGKEGSTPSGMQKLFHKLMSIHEASDAATRVEIFKKAKADGIKKGMTEEDAINYGVFKAREAINFAVHGNSSTINQLRHSIPFFSAALTSLDTVYRSATGFGLSGKEKAEAKAQFKRRAMMMFAMSLAYAMMLQGDEEYEKLPDHVKDNNWLMPNPVGKGFIKFATPFEVGFLFKTIPEVMVRTMAGTSTGKEAIASIQKGLIQNLPGGGVIFSQAIKPAVEVITNHSFFTGNPVESIGDQGKSVANRGQRASETAKMLSRFGLDKIGLSPAKIDHLIQGYFAELGTFVTSAVDTLIYAAEGKTPPAKNFESMQALKPFLTDRNVNKAVSDFYEIEKSAREVVTDLNDMKKKGMIKDIAALVGDEENRKKIAIEPMLRKTMEGMAKIRAQIGYLRENEAGMTAEDRRDKINELTQYMNQYAAQGVKAAKSMGLR